MSPDRTKRPAVITGVVIGFAIFLFAIGTPPGWGYRFFFGFCSFFFAATAIYWIRCNALEKWSDKRVRTILIRLLVLSLATIIIYLFPYRRCVVADTQGRKVYYPIFLDKTLAKIVKDAKGRGPALEPEGFGIDGVQGKIAELPSRYLSSTTAVLLPIHQSIVAMLAAALHLLTLQLQLRQRKQVDVFISYNRAERTCVRGIARQLKRERLSVWLDEWDLPSGGWLVDRIGRAIKASRSAIVFVGASGLGKWQIDEVNVLLTRKIGSGMKVVPILLPNAPTGPVAEVLESLDIPIFMCSMLWLDWRQGVLDERESTG